ncbi:MAG TPA: hypothetical protein VJC21_02440 [Candidatus Nanoarchaeia archaeon]|nr:hypothetical protein [Candidatus Nanoarchaeia archaeon]
MDKPIYTLLTVIDSILKDLQDDLAQKKLFPGINNVNEFYEIINQLELNLDAKKNLRFTLEFREKEYEVLQKKQDKKLEEQLAQRKQALLILKEEYEEEKLGMLKDLSLLPWKAFLEDGMPLYSGLEIFLFPEDDGTYQTAHFEQEGLNRTFTLSDAPYTIEEVLKDIKEANALEHENAPHERRLGEKIFRGNVMEVHHPDCKDVPTLMYLAVEKMQQEEKPAR